MMLDQLDRELSGSVVPDGGLQEMVGQGEKGNA